MRIFHANNNLRIDLPRKNTFVYCRFIIQFLWCNWEYSSPYNTCIDYKVDIKFMQTCFGSIELHSHTLIGCTCVWGPSLTVQLLSNICILDVNGHPHVWAQIPIAPRCGTIKRITVGFNMLVMGASYGR